MTLDLDTTVHAAARELGRREPADAAYARYVAETATTGLRQALIQHRLDALSDPPECGLMAGLDRLRQEAEPVVRAWALALSQPDLLTLCTAIGLAPVFEVWRELEVDRVRATASVLHAAGV